MTFVFHSISISILIKNRKIRNRKSNCAIPSYILHITHSMLKQSRIDDEDYSTSHDIEMFSD